MRIDTPDGFSLNAVFTNAKESSKCVIFAHGMTVGKDDEGIFVRAEPGLNELGFSTLRFDFRAHGRSSGDSIKDFTISGELTDLHACVKFLRQQGFKWIGLAGASFGGSISALYAGEHPKLINKLFLANPVLDYDKAFLHPTVVWAIKTFINFSDKLKRVGFIEAGSRNFKMGKPLMDEMKKYFPYKSLAKYSKPLLIVHGDQDEKVDINHVKDAFEKLPNKNKEFVTIKGSIHGFHEEPYETEIVDMIVQFFSRV